MNAHTPSTLEKSGAARFNPTPEHGQKASTTMRIHEKAQARAELLDEIRRDIELVIRLADRKIRMPYPDGERSDMIRWHDIRGDLQSVTDRATLAALDIYPHLDDAE